MKLPSSAHTSRPWRIHEFTRDFHLEDVWALPTPGGPDDFPQLIELFSSFDPTQSTSPLVRALFAIRLTVGGWLGLDDPSTGVGERVPSLRDRLPADLRATTPASAKGALPFTPLYSLENEWAAETANRTVHGVIHLAWVPDDAGGYRGQLAILVKPNGLLGSSYMTVIKPFRYVIVYPTILRQVEEMWRSRRAEEPDPL